ETVAVRPGRSRCIEFEELCEQHGRYVGGAHRQTGMAGFRLFDGIHGKPANRIGHTGMIDLRHDENPPEMRCLVVGTYRARPQYGRGFRGSRGLDSTTIPVSPRRGNALLVRKVA